MNINTRINAIDGVRGTYWDSNKYRLVVYYSSHTPKDVIKIKVCDAIGAANLQNAIGEITLISIEE